MDMYQIGPSTDNDMYWNGSWYVLIGFCIEMDLLYRKKHVTQKKLYRKLIVLKTTCTELDQPRCTSCPLVKPHPLSYVYVIFNNVSTRENSQMCIMHRVFERSNPDTNICPTHRRPDRLPVPQHHHRRKRSLPLHIWRWQRPKLSRFAIKFLPTYPYFIVTIQPSIHRKKTALLFFSHHMRIQK